MKISNVNATEKLHSKPSGILLFFEIEIPGNSVATAEYLPSVILSLDYFGDYPRGSDVAVVWMR